MHAAAICREVQGDAVMDLGKKLSTPKDIMLEELSLLGNRGSRLFKMRQRRSDKYTFESIQNEANAQLNNDVLTEHVENVEIKEDDGKTPPNTPASGNTNPDGSASDASTEKLTTGSKILSPWEQAIINDPALAEALKAGIPEPEPKAELPDYKCFNRVATPFGGFDKAPRGITFKLPEVDLSPPKYPELQDPGSKRPTFNRTAMGWISDGKTLILPTISLEPVPIPESDDL